MQLFLAKLFSCEPQEQASQDTGVDVLAMDDDGDGYSEYDGDCDDTNPHAYPGAAEKEAVFSCMVDVDQDGWGDATPPTGIAAGRDCNDQDPMLNKDDDDGDGLASCDGDCDDLDGLMNQVDADYDNHSTCDGDCDDNDPYTFPGSAEDESTTECMRDGDNDGWGDPTPPEGIVAGTDCNDYDARENHDDQDGDGFSSCDGDCNDENPNQSLLDLDEDGLSACEGDCDDSNPELNRIDADVDGYTSCNGDCDDYDPNSYPNAEEVCDGQYNNCSSPLYSAIGAPLTEIDNDGDGSVECEDDGVPWMGSGNALGYADCDDSSPVYNQNDLDGDGFSSCENDCDDLDPLTYPGAAFVESETACMSDDDGDGWGETLECCYTIDMHDTWGDGWTGAYLTIYEDGISTGIRTLTPDEGTSATKKICLPDSIMFELEYIMGPQEFESDNSFQLYNPDGDLLMSAGPNPNPGLIYVSNFEWQSFISCTFNPSIESGTDCNDADATVFLGAEELYGDGIDNNCNGITDGHSSVRYGNIKIFGENSEDRLGSLVKSAGDYDGDGHSDLLLGSGTNDTSGEDAGKVYIFSGASLTDGEWIASDATISLTGEAEGDQLGAAFSSAGDIDGDEKDDILIAAPYNDEFGNASGKIYLLTGEELLQGTASLETATWSFHGEAEIDLAGSFVASAGNIDDDSYDDILIGAENHDSLGINKAGKVYLFRGATLNSGLGSNISLENADFMFMGTDAEDKVNRAAVAGDVDGDGLDDVLISSAESDAGTLDAGAIYLISGSNITSGSMLLSDADAIYTGTQVGDLAGFALTGGGDLDGDGFDDILVGAYSSDLSGPNRGTVYVITDAAMQTTSVDLSTVSTMLVGEADGDWAGYSIASMGDIDGDLIPEILIGAPQNDDAYNNAGKAYVVYGASLSPGIHSLSSADLSYTGDATNNYVGFSVGMAGDINLDGTKDILLGGYGNNISGPNTGVMYIFTELMD
ncbi:MAG: hypothetical protein CMK59_11075 [Proteobacteria bacterium]|nr:hypothetical protein [Pseudomonadota bacterium]